VKSFNQNGQHRFVGRCQETGHTHTHRILHTLVLVNYIRLNRIWFCAFKAAPHPKPHPHSHPDRNPQPPIESVWSVSFLCFVMLPSALRFWSLYLYRNYARSAGLKEPISQTNGSHNNSRKLPIYDTQRRALQKRASLCPILLFFTFRVESSIPGP